MPVNRSYNTVASKQAQWIMAYCKVDVEGEGKATLLIALEICFREMNTLRSGSKQHSEYYRSAKQWLDFKYGVLDESSVTSSQ